jgi:hypothetical protein
LINEVFRHRFAFVHNLHHNIKVRPKCLQKIIHLTTIQKKKDAKKSEREVTLMYLDSIVVAGSLFLGQHDFTKSTLKQITNNPTMFNAVIDDPENFCSWNFFTNCAYSCTLNTGEERGKGWKTYLANEFDNVKVIKTLGSNPQHSWAWLVIHRISRFGLSQPKYEQSK